MTDDNNIQLDELFSLPINTYKIANLSGLDLYTSDALKRKYIDAMKKYERTKGIGDKIEKLVESNVLNPCWLSSGLFKLLKHKMIGGADSRIMGFYTPKLHKIFLLMDNNIAFGYASNSRLAQLTIHESLHMAADDMKMPYLAHFKDEFDDYYSALYKDIFKLKDNKSYKKESSDVYHFLFKEFELSNRGSIMGFLKKYYTLLDKSFRNQVDKESGIDFDKLLNDYITLITIYLKGGLAPAIRAINTYRHIFRSMYTAYENGLGVKATEIRSFCIQELFFPSEVICIYSEYTKNPSRVYGALKKIKNKSK